MLSSQIIISSISKSWSVAFIVTMLQFNHISVHVIIFFLFNFSIIVLTFIYFLIFTLLQLFSLHYLFIYPLLLLPFSLLDLFIFSLPSTLISFFLFPLIFLYFCLFLFTPSYYKFVTIFTSILCIVFPLKKKKRGSLSLSLSQFFGGFFIFHVSLL